MGERMTPYLWLTHLGPLFVCCRLLLLFPTLLRLALFFSISFLIWVVFSFHVRTYVSRSPFELTDQKSRVSRFWNSTSSGL